MKLLLAIIFAVSLFTHLLFFGQPKQVVFDEVYTARFISSYSKGEYYFDLHPPLAKLMGYGAGEILGIDYKSIDFGSIGNALSEQVGYLRLLPLIAGILLPIVVYLICIKLNLSKTSSFIASILVCIENSLIVQSRFILFDVIMLLFGFLSVLLYLKYKKEETKKYLIVLSALFASLAFSIKWTALAFVLFIILIEIQNWVGLKRLFKFTLVYLAVGTLVYLSVFYLHFLFFPDLPGTFFHNFAVLNIEMLRSSTTMSATHPYSSLWFTWPIMLRPIFYWQNVEQTRFIYLLGNPFIYLFGILSIIYISLLILLKRIKDNTSAFIVTGFICNFLPFIIIGRVMFLYHYEAALIFAIMAIAFLLDSIKNEKIRKITTIVVVLICIIFFIYFSPLTYGLELNSEQLNSRMWLSSWR